MIAPLPNRFVCVEDDEWGTKCDRHHDREAVSRICVEADSFGAEYSNMCQECLDEYKAHKKQKLNDPSQWEQCPRCKTLIPELSSYRDPDEGSHGPVYQRCSDCVSKFWKRWEEENLDDDYWRD
ncbi:hypothetical protein [Acinetobacter sp. UC24323]|uniref:hypothetical protein n=1 Tax=Acinetobacter sp. UC24323 TaxID=2839946 RepID=UPI0020A11DC8|nr:hypothetical protein [Acinetobacter sp. UC24323]MCO9048778.1 hypothetical protein [Acinetobacter sp. UC24323]